MSFSAGVLIHYPSSSAYYYHLKSFAGDGTGTNTFKLKKVDGAGAEEGDEITVTYTFTATTPPTIKLTTADIEGFGSAGTTFTKHIPSN